MQMNKILLALASAAFVAGTVNAQSLNFAQSGRVQKLDKMKVENTLKTPQFQLNTNPLPFNAGTNLLSSRSTRETAAKVRDPKMMGYLYPFSQYGDDELHFTSMGLKYSNIASYKFCYAAMYPTTVTQLYAGNKITSISFFTYLGNFSGAKVFIAVLDNSTGGLKVVWSSDAEVRGGALNEVPCDYTIDGKSSLLIGFGAKLTADASDENAAKYGVVAPLIDDETKAGQGAYVMLTDDSFSQFKVLGSLAVGQDNSGNPVYSAYPFNVMTEGEEGLKPLDLSTNKTNTVRAAQIGGTVERSIPVMNLGATNVTSFDYDVTLTDKYGNKVKTEKGTHKFDSELPFLGVANVPVTTLLPDYGGWGIDSLNITAVNGGADGFTEDNVSQCLVYALGENPYKRKALVEEWTNTSCGYCPRGLVGVDALAEKYEQGNPESESDINVVSIHSSVYDPSDALADATYQPASWQYGLSLPGAYINRVAETDPFFGDNDGATTAADGIIATVEDYVKNNPICEARIGVSSSYDEASNTITVSSTTNFAVPTLAGEYSVGYIVTEDGLSAAQTNYYAGQTSYNNTDLAPLQKKGQKYVAEFNHVSRYCTNPQGYIVVEQGGQAYLQGLYDAEGAQLPAATTDAPVNHTTTIKLDNVDNSTCNVLAVLYDNKTREIVNSACAWLGKTSSGIENNTVAAPEALVGVANGAFTVTAQNAKAEVFNLNGQLVTSATVNGSASLPTFGKGVYVIRVTENGKVFSKKAAF